MKFRTELSPSPFSVSIKHDHPILSIGSCFANHVLEKLRDYKFPVQVNPFGTTYNPLSIADQLTAIHRKRLYDVVDLEKYRDSWISFDHHGSFASPTSKGAVDLISNRLESAQNKVGKYRWTILSLGTAWAWFKEGKVVNNCHQIPEREFDFRLLSIDEMHKALSTTISNWQESHPNHVFLITVSPVRHLRSGLMENNRSKARLLEVAHLLNDEFEFVHYYPSYELILDDLRDYRFYDHSLTHPSQQAIEYVWEHFQGTFFDSNTTNTLESFDGFRRALYHRPRQTSGPAFDGHLKSLEKKFEAWIQRWPDADWREEKLRWNELIRMS